MSSLPALHYTERPSVGCLPDHHLWEVGLAACRKRERGVGLMGSGTSEPTNLVSGTLLAHSETSFGGDPTSLVGSR
jgi:hypothetical protein